MKWESFGLNQAADDFDILLVRSILGAIFSSQASLSATCYFHLKQLVSVLDPATSEILA